MSSGNLATVTDSETGIVTTYYYDLLNRQSGYREKGTNLDHSVKYEYDDKNNLASMTETVGGVTKTYTYTYDEDNRLISESIGEPVVSEPPENNITITYSYDGFGRLETRTVKQGETTIQTTSPTYSAGSAENTTTGQISSYNGYTYTYDKNGNILTVSDGTNTTSYEYDSQNQLIRELNQAQQKAYVWEYDNAGNILSKEEYSYKNNRVGSLLKSVPYYYTDHEWGDLLTYYNRINITYDTIGNPLNDGTWSYTWQHGRELVSMSDGTTTWTFTYGADGMRTKRTDGTNTYTYVYNGSKLTLMTKGDDTLQFTYDASGTPLAVIYNGVTYYYHTNLQGDILGIKDASGNAVVTYAYDAWGKLLSTAGTMADSLGAVNPLRYRGYVYDTETGFYYLQSRYYDPEICRFINADGLVSTGQGFIGNNMFAYCGNNPICRIDCTGYCYFDGYGNWRHDNWEFLGGYTIKPSPILAKQETEAGTVVIVDGTVISENTAKLYSNPEKRPNLVIIRDLRSCDANCPDSNECNPNMQVVYSNRFIVGDDRESILQFMYKYDEANPSKHRWNRTIDSMMIEWDAHNFFAAFDESAKHTDFDFKEEGKGWDYFVDKASSRFFSSIFN